VTSLIGAFIGVVVVAGIIALAWFISQPSPDDAVFLALVPTKATQKESTEVMPAESVMGLQAKPKPSLPTRRISMQEVAQMEIDRLREPASRLYSKKPESDTSMTIDNLDPASPLLNEAESLLKMYLAAPFRKKKTEYVMHAPETLEHMTKFYDVQGNQDPVIGKRLEAQLLRVGSAMLIQLVYASPSRIEQNVVALFHQTKGAGLLLDWESWVGYSDVGWTQYQEDKPQNPAWFCVVAEAADYYNYEFSDRARYVCLRLSNPEGTHFLYGYVLRSSQLGHYLNTRLNTDDFAITGRRTVSMKLLVKTSFPYPAKSNQCVNIREAVTDRWFMFDWEAGS